MMPDSPLFKLPNTFRAFYGAFSALRTAQREAITPIIQGRSLILQAATGSGKSEAVLAPCIERLIQSERRFTLLYIVPTRALAVDLKRRFDTVITDRLGLNLSIRTGDLKRSGGSRPDMMFTTPESLDVMLGSADKSIKAFLGRVECVIIDEVHPLIYTYRGVHLAHLLTRLERRNQRAIQRIAMSATLADADNLIQAFDFRPFPETCHIQATVNRAITAHIVHLKKESIELPAFLNDLHDTWNYSKILLFANSRGACDRLFGILNRSGRFKGASVLHYSNLKPTERKAAEKRFRKNSRALCIATSTLELGIDVGDVDAVLLYEPPDTVSAFLQRIGRANRREKSLNFWGICRGEQASLQVVRFLSLLALARQGIVESPPPRTLPSVLSQQIISCLYEKKRISLPAMRDLFQRRKNGPQPEADLLPEICADDSQTALAALFQSLEKKRWIKKSLVSGLYSGGLQYGRHLTEYKIWGNFPESEEAYILETATPEAPAIRRAIADIPSSIVKQIAVGDRLDIAGRRLKIISINPDAKRVLALPATSKPEKEIIWLGAGGHVSVEVARMMRRMLRSSAESGTGATDDPALLSRARRLFEAELDRRRDVVRLDNGVDVMPTQRATYLFQTYLGSVGNLVLEWCIRNEIDCEEIYVSSNEVGVESSRFIRFETLNLPEDRNAFEDWVRVNLKILASLIPLNLFCKTLPTDLLITEVSDFLFDQRVIDAFRHYRNHTSEVVSGDIEALQARLSGDRTSSPDNQFSGAQEDRSAQNDPPRPLDITPGISLLEQEKRKWLPRPLVSLPSAACLEQRPDGAITATMVSDYFLHAQCRRRFCFKYLRMSAPANDAGIDKAALMRQGLVHEETVLNALRDSGKMIVDMKERNFLETIIALAAGTLGISDESGTFLFQSALKLEAIVPEQCGLKAVGVPDLIFVSIDASGDEKRIVLEVGDIKSSTAPRYHHKWQVAFYALLLKEILARHDIPARVSPIGFLMTRPAACNEKAAHYEKHTFELVPFTAAFPMLLETLAATLAKPLSQVTCRLEPHCAACEWLADCYAEALAKEDIQFLPGLTAGTLQKLRRAGIATFEALKRNSAVIAPLFSSGEIRKLVGGCEAILNNRITLHKPKTRCFPGNLSAYFFIHLIKEPTSQLPVAFGLLILDEQLKTVQTHVRVVKPHPAAHPSNETQSAIEHNNLISVWREFAQILLKEWHQRVFQGRGPHIFYFGGQTIRMVSELSGPLQATSAAGAGAVNRSRWSDIKKLFSDHFHLPASGNVSLFTLSSIFGCNHGIEPPATLFHSQDHTFHGGNASDESALETQISTALAVISDLFKIARPLLESQWMHIWEPDADSPFDIDPVGISSSGRPEELPPPLSKEAFARFIGEEKRLKEEDILELQELSLSERMEKFRSLGYLLFNRTGTDAQGRTLYLFSITDKAMPSKFRQGDFLKLAPQGTTDIQEGHPVIISKYDMDRKEVALASRSGRLNLNKRCFYSLEEDITDFTEAKLSHAAEFLFSEPPFHPVNQLLAGMWRGRQERDAIRWIGKWIQNENQGAFGFDMGLNASQIEALVLPFCYKTALIQGPPGTGKTHLLAWILIVLVIHAFEHGRPLRIGISALTHQAIDNVLRKVVLLVNTALPKKGNFSGRSFPAACLKWGRDDRRDASENLAADLAGKRNSANDMEVEFSEDATDVLSRKWAIIGATGFGFYNLFNSRGNEFPEALDWIVFDEASQVVLPQALLSLIYGNGNFLFLGDIHQLPPIVTGDYGELNHSILTRLMEIYPESHQVTLVTTYRMNRGICEFPSRMWYRGRLHPAPGNADARLRLKGLAGDFRADALGRSQDSNRRFAHLLDPSKPVLLVLAEHEGCSQQCDMEVELMAGLAHELMTYHGLKSEQIALISPHRAQNNAIARRLSEMMAGEDHGSTDAAEKNSIKPEVSLPLIDTVERSQGAEREVIIFGLTSSDPDHISSEFLNSPNRLNVAMTRAKQKLIIIGSSAFFSAIPDNEAMLEKNRCFKELLAHCKGQDCCFTFHS